MSNVEKFTISAIISRGTKKDFVDMFYILQTYKPEELLQFYSEKYNQQNYEYVLLKSLAYFTDAEEDPMPKMLKKTGWDDIKIISLLSVLVAVAPASSSFHFTLFRSFKSFKNFVFKIA